MIHQGTFRDHRLANILQLESFIVDHIDVDSDKSNAECKGFPDILSINICDESNKVHPGISPAVNIPNLLFFYLSLRKPLCCDPFPISAVSLDLPVVRTVGYLELDVELCGSKF